MKPVSGISLPGTSINFDAQALHDAEEAEYQQEEHERQNELRQLLTSAFDDDLSDDEESLVSPQDVSQMSNSSIPQPQAMQNQGTWPVHAVWGPSSYPQLQTSTPHSGPAPPLQTPMAGVPYDYAYYGQPAGGDFSAIPYSAATEWKDGTQPPAPLQNGGTETNGSALYQPYAPTQGQFTSMPYAGPANFYGGMHEQYPQQSSEVPTSDRVTSQQSPRYQQGASQSPRRNEGSANSPRYQGDGAQSDDFVVKYQGGRQVERQRSDDAKGTTDEPLGLQKQFLEQGGDGDSRQLAQLQILYKARGRKIDELSQQLKQLEEDSGREIRILTHQVSLKEGERDGFAASMEQLKQLLNESRSKENSSQGELTALRVELQALQTAKQQLVVKLESSESAVEHLTTQLTALAGSECLDRAKQQHESAISSLQQRHANEILGLNEALDSAQRLAQERGEEVANLKTQVSNLLKAAEEAQLDRAETVNRLARSLEQTQLQCRQLLETGTGQEIGLMKLQLQEAIAGKSISEDLNTALQNEIRELKEQVTLYESVSRLGALPGANTLDDSYAQLGIKKTHLIRTPEPDRTPQSSGNLSSEQTVASLKAELQRCLALYRTKREQANTLTTELSDVTARAEKAELDAACSKKMLEDLQHQVADTRAGVSQSNDMKTPKVTTEKEQKELEELKSRLQELSETEQSLITQNKELSAQMALLVKEADEDKMQAVERCRNTMAQHYEDTKDVHREEILAQARKEQEELTRSHEEQMSTLRSEMEQLQAELDGVKELYVEVCREKDELDKRQIEIEEAHAAEMEKLQHAASSEKTVSLDAAKEEWLKEIQDRNNQDLQQQLAAAKQIWLIEQQAANEEALRLQQEEFVKNGAEQLGNSLEKARLEWQTESRITFETELSERLARAKQTWHDTELREAIATAKETWLMAECTNIEQTLATAREDWINNDLPVAIASAKETWLEKDLKEALESAKQTWQESMAKSTEDVVDKNVTVTLQTDSEEAIAEARRLWETVDLADALQHARQQWQTTELNDALQAAKVQWRDTELAELERVIREQEQHRAGQLHSALEVVQGEVQQMMEQRDNALKAVQQEEQQQKEQLAKIELLKEELAVAIDAQSRLLAEKDAERKKAVSDVRESCQRDYQTFVTEHQNTLADALKSARQQFTQQKEELVKLHEVELEELRKQIPQKGSVEEWEEERLRLTQELAERDQLLQAADAHMQREVERLQAQLEQTLDTRLRRQLTTLRSQLQAQHADRFALLTDQQRELQARLEASTSRAAEAESRCVDAESRRQEAESCFMEAESKLAKAELLQAELESKLTEVESAKVAAEAGLQQAESQLKAGQEAWQASEEQWRQKVALCEQMTTRARQEQEVHAQRQRALVERSQQLEALVRRSGARMDDLKREHAKTLDTAIGKLNEAHNQQMTALKQQHVDELHNCKRDVEAAVLTALKRDTQHTPTQTEAEHIEVSALTELHNQYLGTVKKIKDDVLRHMDTSSERAAETVRTQVVREREGTARRLRSHYMRSLAELLETDYNCVTKEQKLAAMERALNRLPFSGGTSRATSACALSSCATPTLSTPHPASTFSTPPSDRSGGGGKAVVSPPVSERDTVVGFREYARPAVADTDMSSRTSNVSSHMSAVPAGRISAASSSRTAVKASGGSSVGNRHTPEASMPVSRTSVSRSSISTNRTPVSTVNVPASATFRSPASVVHRSGTQTRTPVSAVDTKKTSMPTPQMSARTPVCTTRTPTSRAPISATRTGTTRSILKSSKSSPPTRQPDNLYFESSSAVTRSRSQLVNCDSRSSLDVRGSLNGHGSMDACGSLGSRGSVDGGHGSLDVRGSLDSHSLVDVRASLDALDVNQPPSTVHKTSAYRYTSLRQSGKSKSMTQLNETTTTPPTRRAHFSRTPGAAGDTVRKIHCSSPVLPGSTTLTVPPTREEHTFEPVKEANASLDRIFAQASTDVLKPVAKLAHRTQSSLRPPVTVYDMKNF